MNELVRADLQQGFVLSVMCPVLVLVTGFSVFPEVGSDLVCVAHRFRTCYATALLFINSSSSTGLRFSPERIMKAFCSLWLLLSLVELGPAPPASQGPPLACRGAADPATPQPEVTQAEPILKNSPQRLTNQICLGGC